MNDSTYISNAEAPGPVDWVHAAFDIASRQSRCILIFIANDEGSTPREKGVWALVGEDDCHGTLGGGEVERMAIADARDLLANRKTWQRFTEQFKLGPDLGQCCGGVMTMLFEPVDASSIDWLREAKEQIGGGYILIPSSEPAALPRVVTGPVPDNLYGSVGLHIQALDDDRPLIVLYGGGHVGRAIAAMAAQLPVRLDVVDERLEALTEIPRAGNVKTIHRESPPSHAKTLDNADAVLIMTHNHGLDYRLCQMLLGKPEISYLGLIGSATKAARFRSGLSKEGFKPDVVDHLTCPIGAAGPSGKEPGIIAIAALNEIIHVISARRMGHPRHNKITHQIKRDC